MDPREIIDALTEIVNNQQTIGDKLRSLSAKTDDLDIVALINSLSSSAYDMAQDIQDSIDTYKEILESEMEELNDEEDLELAEPEEEA